MTYAASIADFISREFPDLYRPVKYIVYDKETIIGQDPDTLKENITTTGLKSGNGYEIFLKYCNVCVVSVFYKKGHKGIEENPVLQQLPYIQRKSERHYYIRFKNKPYITQMYDIFNNFIENHKNYHVNRGSMCRCDILVEHCIRHSVWVRFDFSVSRYQFITRKHLT